MRVMLIEQEGEHGWGEYTAFYHVFGRAMDYDESKDEVTYTPDGVYFERGDVFLHDFRTYSQGNGWRRSEGVYAWTCEFHDVHSVDHERAKRMLATLDRIQKYSAKAEERDGSCETYGHFVLRTCRAVGIEWMLFRSAGGGFVKYSLADGQRRIDAMVNAWVHADAAIA